MKRSIFDGAILTSIEWRIERGQIYEFTDTLDIANAGGTGQWLMRTGSKIMTLEERRITTNGDEMTYEAFGLPTVTSDGTALSVGARNAIIPADSTVKFFRSPTVSADGTPAAPVYMPGASGQGNSTLGQFDHDGLVRILPANTDFLLRITNDGAKNPAKTQIYLVWAELTDPTPE